MPQYKCPTCPKSFGEGTKSKAIYCPDCKKMVNTVEVAPVETAPTGVVVAVGSDPMPPSLAVPDAPSSSASLPPPLSLEGREPVHLPVVETVQAKIQRVANKKLTTATYFSWCPVEYIDGYIKAARDGTILQQGRIKQPSPPQGGGLYCVGSPVRSSAWAKKGCYCMAVQMVNVPTICLHDDAQMAELAPIDANALYDNRNVDALYLLTYGGSDGGFSRLTASAGVTVTIDLIAVLGEEGCVRERARLFTDARAPWDVQIAALKKLKT